MQYEKNEVLPVIRQLIIEKKQNNNYSIKTNQRDLLSVTTNS